MTILKLSVLAVSLLLHILWALLIPPYQGNDEERHFATVLFFSEEKRFISKQDQGLGFRDSSWYKQLRAEIIRHESHRVFANPLYHRDYTEDQNLSSEIEDINVSPGYPYQPGYYLFASIAGSTFSSLQAKLYAARFVSIVFSMLTVYFVYKIIRHVTKQEFLSIIGTALVAFFPIMTYAGSMVNNDSIVGFSATWCVYLLLTIQKNQTPRNVLLLSFGIALGLMSKPQFIPIGVATIGVALYLIYTQNDYWKERLKSALQLFSVSAILALPWYIFNLFQFGSFFPETFKPGVGISGMVEKSGIRPEGIHNIVYLGKSVIMRWFSHLPPRFAGDFGQVDIQAPAYANTLFQIGFILFFIGGLFLLVRYLLRKRKLRFYHLVFLIITLSLEGLYTFLWIRGIWRNGGATFPLFARYYFPLSSIGAYVVMKVISLGSSFRYFAYILLSISVSMLAYNFYCILLVITKYYL